MGTATGDRIRSLRERRGWSGYKLAEEAGLTPTHVKAIEDGTTLNPRGDTLTKLAAALGVEVGELLGTSITDHDAPRAEHTVDVVMRGVSSGGPAIESDDVKGETYPLLHHLWKKGRFVVRLYGDSMWPNYWDGDLLLAEEKKRVTDGQVAIVKLGSESTIKRIYRRKGGGYTLRADNPHPNYKPIETEAGEVEILAEVLKIVEGKRP